ncbi:hypothetical protein EON67_12010 [archaeon]|nr:MAG: hypothetical protein EON67_12010 [archaeon]
MAPGLMEDIATSHTVRQAAARSQLRGASTPPADAPAAPLTPNMPRWMRVHVDIDHRRLHALYAALSASVLEEFGVAHDVNFLLYITLRAPPTSALTACAIEEELTVAFECTSADTHVHVQVLGADERAHFNASDVDLLLLGFPAVNLHACAAAVRRGTPLVLYAPAVLDGSIVQDSVHACAGLLQGAGRAADVVSTWAEWKRAVHALLLEAGAARAHPAYAHKPAAVEVAVASEPAPYLVRPPSWRHADSGGWDAQQDERDQVAQEAPLWGHLLPALLDALDDEHSAVDDVRTNVEAP